MNACLTFAGHRLGIVLLASLLLAASVLASDPPHYNPSGGISCENCHIIHGGMASLLKESADNGNLCMNCHSPGTPKPFSASDQALTWPAAGTNATGTSHRWDTGAGGVLKFVGVSPLSAGIITPTGLYTGNYPGSYTLQILSSGAVGTAQFSWSSTLPGATAGTNFTGTNVALDSGILLTFANATNPVASFLAGDKWNLFVRPDLRNSTNTALTLHMLNGAVRCSTCHDQHLEAKPPFDPAAQPYTTNAFGAFIGTNRHFMRITNDLHQLCNDCHAPRVVTNAVYGSHPVEIYFTNNAYYQRPTQLPVEVATTNLGCLTCHQIHYAPDSDGKLLRMTNSVALCADCHTLANTASAHFSKTNPATLWPGGKYGSLMPARTDVNDRGTCLNCHAVHGWPDAATPTNHYPHLLTDYEENFCFTCHGTNGPAAKLVQTAFAATYHHPVANNDPKRRAGRSVECVDCHNPHKAKANSHIYTNTATAFRNAITNTPSLIGVDGVSVNYSGLTNYQVISTNRYAYIPDTNGASYEYQICFKCHTGYSFPSYAVGTANFTAGSINITGSGTAWTTNMIGMWLGRSNDTRLSVITNVLNATNLVIMPAFSNSTASAQSYTIWNITAGLTPIYSAGTAAFTTNSTTVTGTGTSWNSGMVGLWIYLTNNPVATYKIVAVVSTTSLRISPAFARATVSAQGYAISGDTDLAQDFNPFNKSGHPIVTGLDNYSNSVVVGGKRGLLAAALKAPWNVNVGSQTMLCSDCHDATTTNYVPSAAQGPHGSAYQYMLRGPNGANWPTGTSFATSWCANCHNDNVSLGGESHTGHPSAAGCYTCHIVVPHGGKMSRLIASNGGNMPARYAYQNSLANVGFVSFLKTTATGYSENGNCKTTCGHHGSGPVNETW